MIGWAEAGSRKAAHDDNGLTFATLNDMSGTSSTSNAVAYFGYGSLVNELTWLQSERRHPERYPVDVQNWTRQWGHCLDTPHGSGCVLTAVERAGGRIQGILQLPWAHA